MIEKELVLPLFKFKSYKDTIFYLNKLKILYKLRINKQKIILYNSINNFSWNGGRPLSIDLSLEEIENLNSNGIRIALTFTNQKLKLNELEIINFLDKLNNLQKKYNIKNQIVLANYRLFWFLKKNYDFDLVASITIHPNFYNFLNNKELKRNMDNSYSSQRLIKKKIYNKDKIFNYYNQLYKNFDIVIPHHELIFKRWFINFLKENNYLANTEIILNLIRGCLHCPFHRQHYKLIGSEKTKESLQCHLKNNLNCSAIVKPKQFKFIKKTYNIYKFDGRTSKNFNEFFKVFLSEHLPLLKK